MSTTDEKVAFIQRHEPTLKDGEYDITVSQNMSLLGGEVGGPDSDLSGSITKRIYVAGERYNINQSRIFKQFPPPHNTGDYSNVLPHIALTRSTLPWEREAVNKNGKVPWMFLFVYDDEDVQAGNVIKPTSMALNDLFSTTSGTSTIKAKPEPGDETATGGFTSDRKIDVIKLSLNWLNGTGKGLIPSTDDLKLLTSVRINQPTSGPPTEHAICMANRVPKKGIKTYACLISLEGRFDSSGNETYTTEGISGTTGNQFPSFVALNQWSFTCMDTNCYQVNQKTLQALTKEVQLPLKWTTAGTVAANDPIIKSYSSASTVLSALNTKFGALPAGLNSPYVQGQITAVFVKSGNYKISQKRLKTMAGLLIKQIPSVVLTALSFIDLPEFYTDQTSFETALEAALEDVNGGTLPDKYSTNSAGIIACFQVPDRTFQGILKDLSSAAFRSDTLTSTSDVPQTDTLNQYLASGAIPFPHHLQEGGRTVSWYRGPFKPNDAPINENPFAKVDKHNPKNFTYRPVLSSDQLLKFDDTLNMLDVSYAAAWELGRMLTLNNKSVSMDLYTWKRQQKWKANRMNSTAGSILRNESNDNSVTKEETAIKSWLDQLSKLGNIPFNYLVSDERMLPSESIRFFTLDELWVQCLLDGALSIGRVGKADVESDMQSLAPLIPTTSYTGFILRSEVVSGWPHTEMTVTDSSGTVLTPVPKISLGPDMILCLFSGGTAINSVDFHLKPESLHFGFEGDSPSFTSPVRFKFTDISTPKVTSILPYDTVTIKSKYYDSDSRLVHIGKLSGKQQTISGTADAFTSAQFAMSMIIGVPHVTLSNAGSKTGTNDHLSLNPTVVVRDSGLDNGGLGPAMGTDFLSSPDDAEIVPDEHENLMNEAGIDIREDVEKVETSIEEIIDKVEAGVEKEVEHVEIEAVDVWEEIDDIYGTEGHKPETDTEQPQSTESAELTAKPPSKGRKISFIFAFALLGAAILYWIYLLFID